MMKRIQLFLFIFFFTFLLVVQFGSKKIFAQTTGTVKTDVVVFLREGCQHCKNEEVFLKKLQEKRDDIRIITYRLENHTQRQIWEAFTTRTKTSKVTPITVIGDHYLIGFDTPETTGKEILSLIDTAQRTGTKTNLENNDLQLGSTTNTCVEDATIPCTVTNKQPFYLSVPFFGKIDTAKYPLLALSALLGFFDGFNPCALWVLITFLIILMQLGNKKKMFLFAGTFILAEAIMYALILTVWFKTWDFVQLDSIITPLVGVLAIGGGLFFLNEYRKKEIECKVTNLQQRHHIKQRIETLAFGKFTFLTFLGILAIAFSVNIIEFACSIGIPQAFTKILELNQLPALESIFYIGVYILFYMLDDVIVFGLALYGAEKLALTTKYSKFSNLIGGIVMILLGILLLIKPNLLLF